MNALRKWRQEQGLSQAEAAALAGVTQQAWSKYERGRVPEAGAMPRVCRITGLTPNDFYEIDRPASAEPVVGDGAQEPAPAGTVPFGPYPERPIEGAA